MAITVKHLKGREEEISIQGGHALERYLVAYPEWGGDKTFSPLNTQAQGLPAVGSPHPAYNYIVVTRIFRIEDAGASRWVVGVEYGYPSFLTSGEMFDSDWQYSIRGADRTDRIRISLPSDPLGSREIGPWIYTIPQNVNFATHQAGNVPLFPGERRKIVGTDRQVKGAQITMVRRQANFNASKFGLLIDAHWSVNVSNFLSAAPGTIALTDYAIELSPSEGQTGGQGSKWDVMLVFLWNPIGHQHVAYHTWDDDKAGETVVNIKDGPPVIEEWKIYETADFAGIIAAIKS